jgi:hypothetical protein
LGSVTCDAFSKFRVPVNWASRDTKRARPLLSCHLADLGSQTGLVSREVAYPAPLPCLTRAPTPSSRHPRSTAGVGPQCPGYSRSRAPKRSSPCLTHHHLRWRHHHQPACPSTPPHDRFGASVGAQLASAMATGQWPAGADGGRLRCHEGNRPPGAGPDECNGGDPSSVAAKGAIAFEIAQTRSPATRSGPRAAAPASTRIGHSRPLSRAVTGLPQRSTTSIWARLSRAPSGWAQFAAACSPLRQRCWRLLVWRQTGSGRNPRYLRLLALAFTRRRSSGWPRRDECL